MIKNDIESLEREKHDLLFGVRRSVRYHNRREMFFDRFHTITSAVNIIFGSATILSVLGDLGKVYPVVAASIVTVFSALDLVVGTAKMARMHNNLARRFIILEKEMITKKDFAEEDLQHFVGIRLDIEADEPPILKVLDSICHNELMRAMGYPKDKWVKIRWYQRMLAQFLDIREYAIHTD